MTDLNKGQDAGHRPRKYLWFGYGNYGGGHPNMQIGGGNIRDPGLFEELSKNTKTERSWLRVSLYAAAVLAGVMLLVMLLAWGLSLLVR